MAERSALQKLRARLLERFAAWVIGHAQRTPYFHLSNADGTPYMDRFWLLRLGRTGTDDRGQPRPWIALRVHHIRSSDAGRDFHDHPWSFVSLILRGGYREDRPYAGAVPVVADAVPSAIAEQPYTSTWYGAGALLFRRAATWHRLTLDDQQLAAGTWTLVLTLPPADRRWGFLVRGRKVDHREYFRRGMHRNG